MSLIGWEYLVIKSCNIQDGFAKIGTTNTHGRGKFLHRNLVACSLSTCNIKIAQLLVMIMAMSYNSESKNKLIQKDVASYIHRIPKGKLY